MHCKTVCIYTTFKLFPYAIYVYTTNFIQKTKVHEQPLQPEENKVGRTGLPKAQTFRPQELRQGGAGGGGTGTDEGPDLTDRPLPS